MNTSDNFRQVADALAQSFGGGREDVSPLEAGNDNVSRRAESQSPKQIPHPIGGLWAIKVERRGQRDGGNSEQGDSLMHNEWIDVMGRISVGV